MLLAALIGVLVAVVVPFSVWWGLAALHVLLVVVGFLAFCGLVEWAHRWEGKG